jgi:hypothetical protein
MIGRWSGSKSNSAAVVFPLKQLEDRYARGVINSLCNPVMSLSANENSSIVENLLENL